jgi:hypothetical protein
MAEEMNTETTEEVVANTPEAEDVKKEDTAS